VTVSGRINRTRLDNVDQITPSGDPGSLDGQHTFTRLNPAAGITFSPTPAVNLYGGYSEGSRAPTSIELGCANPDEPCKLPNAMAGDPPLDQVVTRTFDGGVRLHWRGARWNAGVFRGTNHDDILFVTSEVSGFGYFRNFGQTRRQGLELGVLRVAGRISGGVNYTFLVATYQSGETVNGAGNSTNDAAIAGLKGLEGTIEIEPGDAIPLVAAHTFKAFAGVALTHALSVDLDLVAASGSYARGNENNRHQRDGVAYLGPGRTSAYAVVNLGARFQLRKPLQLFVQVNNVLDLRYSTAAELGATGFADDLTFIARPLPSIDGEFPIRQTTFFAPGAPRSAWAGVRMTF
jgi:outer membrane receptor protein involved in Fe transport